MFWATALILQVAGGAHHNEFGGHWDEAGHYVTGLMVHDYLASPSQWAHPGRFAADYYQHYPKVALGHWPPFFYLVQSAWTLPFSPTRISLLVLMALLTALLAGTLYPVLRAEVGPPAALVLCLVFLALPLVQLYTDMLMADILLAGLCFGAILCFGHFLDTGRWPSALGFGLLASLAILTKGSAMVLAVVPPAALVLSRRWHLATRPAFWLPAAVVLVLCGPWSWATRHLAHEGFLYPSPTPAFTIPAVAFYSKGLIEVVGVGLLLSAGIGLFVRLVKPSWQGGAGGIWAAAGSLLAGVLAFHCLVPVGFEERYLLPALPVLFLFVAAGAAWLAERWPRRSTPAFRKAGVTLALALFFALENFALPKNAFYGFDPMADELLARPQFQDAVFLVASESRGEGAFIAAVAARESRPGHVVLRSSKLLANINWMGQGEANLYQTPDEVLHCLEQSAVEVVVVDTSALQEPGQGRVRLVLEAMANHPERWELMATHSLVREAVEHPEALRVYRFAGRPTLEIKAKGKS
ncbi:MAG: glycosyltransferase family 39 protein [Planctomycetes bacterium]|nr:glycosyltransferase family 39 protein [Planctomycetota bacterium]